MGVRDWNFKQKPSGLWKRLLRSPVYLFRARLGFLFGERLLLISHVGRASGRRFETPVEVVEHDRGANEYIVCSGTGPRADWYLNIVAHPTEQVQVGNRRWHPRQRSLSQQEAAGRFAHYEHGQPRPAARLLKSMGNSYDGTDGGRFEMIAQMPMIAFSDR